MTQTAKHAASTLSLVPAPAAIHEVHRIVAGAVDGRDLAEVFADLARVPTYLLEPERPEEASRHEAAERAEVWRAQHPTADREAIWRDRGIPAKDIDRLLANDLRETPALARVRRWLCEGERVLVLAGPPDAGKTTAASFAAAQDPSEADRRWYREQLGVPTVVYLEVEMLLQVWLHRSGKGAVTREPLTNRSRNDLVSCWLLVIDDLGQEASTDNIVAMVGEAVDHLIKLRSDRRLRTLITTNIRRHSPTKEHPEDPKNPTLVARYGARGQRIRERLTEFGAWFPAQAQGLRRSGGKEEEMRGTSGAPAKETP